MSFLSTHLALPRTFVAFISGCWLVSLNFEKKSDDLKQKIFTTEHNLTSSTVPVPNRKIFSNRWNSTQKLWLWKSNGVTWRETKIKWMKTVINKHIRKLITGKNMKTNNITDRFTQNCNMWGRRKKNKTRKQPKTNKQKRENTVSNNYDNCMIFRYTQNLIT